MPENKVILYIPLLSGDQEQLYSLGSTQFTC